MPGAPADQIVSHVLEGREIGGSVISADAAFVVAKNHVHNPMQAVFHTPMPPHDRPELAREPDQGGQVEAGLLLDFSIDFTPALDHENTLQSGPIMALLQPADIVDRRIGSHFNAAVIAVDGLVATDVSILETIGLLLGDEDPDILAQRALIAFEREDVVGLAINDLLGDVALTAHGIDAHDRALNRQQSRRFR